MSKVVLVPKEGLDIDSSAQKHIGKTNIDLENSELLGFIEQFDELDSFDSVFDGLSAITGFILSEFNLLEVEQLDSEVANKIMEIMEKSIRNDFYVYERNINKMKIIKNIDNEINEFKDVFIDSYCSDYDDLGIFEYLLVKKTDIKHEVISEYEDIKEIMGSLSVISYDIDNKIIKKDILTLDNIDDFIYQNVDDVIGRFIVPKFLGGFEKMDNIGVELLNAFDKFVKEYYIISIIEGEVYLMDEETMIDGFEELSNSFKEYEASKRVNNFENKMLDEVIDKSLTKFESATITLSNTEHFIAFDVNRVNGELIYSYEGCEGTEEEIEELKSTILYLIGTSNFSTVMIRVKTNVKDGNESLYEIYGFTYDINKDRFEKIDYKALRKAYSIDSQTGLPIEVSPNDIFCDIDGNKTGKLID